MLAVTCRQKMPMPTGDWPIQEEEMLYTLAVILLVAWLLGLGGVYAIGSLVHLLLVIAVVLFLVGIISGRRTVV